MSRLNLKQIVVLIFGCFFTIGCGLTQYPGQLGMVTNGYSKIDLELLDDSGLWVYEVSYDNREGRTGVAAVVTKHYDKALTYTSNSRSGADGTFYRHKEALKGAKIEMVYLPQLDQVVMPPDSKVQIFMEYDVSFDEVDDRNIAEEDLFAEAGVMPGLQRSNFLRKTSQAWQMFRFQVARIGRLLADGRLNYEVAALRFLDKRLAFDVPLSLTINRLQNAIRGHFTLSDKEALVTFLDENFPNGFKGDVGVELRGGEVLKAPVSLYTRSSLVQSGRSVVIESNDKFIQNLADKMAQK